MSSTDEGRRKYDASRRQADAETRQRRIIDAATELFLQHGFGATAINQIATAAAVSVQSVYSIYGSKAGVLAKAIDVAVVGDFDDRPVLERIAPLRTAATAERRTTFVEFAQFIRQLNERVAPLIRVLEQAASGDETLEQLRAQLVAAIRSDSLQWITQLGPTLLRPGLSLVEAADVMATTVSPYVYSTLCVDAGWTADQYERWLAHALPHLLLAPEAI